MDLSLLSSFIFPSGEFLGADRIGGMNLTRRELRGVWATLIYVVIGSTALDLAVWCFGGGRSVAITALQGACTVFALGFAWMEWRKWLAERGEPYPVGKHDPSKDLL